jgi:hypothetical protein
MRRSVTRSATYMSFWSSEVRQTKSDMRGKFSLDT